LKCDAIYCNHKVTLVCEILKKSLIIEAYDEAYNYHFEVYLDNELCDEGESRLIYESAEKGDYEKILTLICED